MIIAMTAHTSISFYQMGLAAYLRHKLERDARYFYEPDRSERNATWDLNEMVHGTDIEQDPRYQNWYASKWWANPSSLLDHDGDAAMILDKLCRTLPPGIQERVREMDRLKKEKADIEKDNNHIEQSINRLIRLERNLTSFILSGSMEKALQCISNIEDDIKRSGIVGITEHNGKIVALPNLKQYQV